MSTPYVDIESVAISAPRVEAVIADVMKRYPGDSKAALARYFEAVHQELGPLARQLERELTEARDALAGAAAAVADSEKHRNDLADKIVEQKTEIGALRGRALPVQLTPPLRRVLGMMLWETGPIADAMRASGRDIARNAGDEQAAVMHWLLGFVIQHGAEWHRHSAIALREMTDQMNDKRW